MRTGYTSANTQIRATITDIDDWLNICISCTELVFQSGKPKNSVTQKDGVWLEMALY
jgi:hypothetical protein